MTPGHIGLTWDDVHAIRASSEPAVALARLYHVSDTLIGKIRPPRAVDHQPRAPPQ
jgi:hypothetical protein